MSKVILVRHGATALNRGSVPGVSAERLRGWLDVPLDEMGRHEALAVAETLCGEAIRRIYTSDLMRARATAYAIAAQARAPVIETSDLRPWNVGQWAGQPVEDVLPEMLRCVEHPDRFPEGGEPFREFAKRWLRRLIGILRESRRLNATIVAVSHTRNTQLAKAWVDSGAQLDLSYSPKRMNDYSDEVQPGQKYEIET